MTGNKESIQWNLSVTDTLGSDIFGHFLLQYRGFLLSEIKNALMTSVGTTDNINAYAWIRNAHTNYIELRKRSL